MNFLSALEWVSRYNVKIIKKKREFHVFTWKLSRNKVIVSQIFSSKTQLSVFQATRSRRPSQSCAAAPPQSVRPNCTTTATWTTATVSRPSLHCKGHPATIERLMTSSGGPKQVGDQTWTCCRLIVTEGHRVAVVTGTTEYLDLWGKTSHNNLISVLVLWVPVLRSTTPGTVFYRTQNADHWSLTAELDGSCSVVGRHWGTASLDATEPEANTSPRFLEVRLT